MKVSRFVRVFFACLSMVGYCGFTAQPAHAIVGSSASYGEIVFFGAAPQSAGGPPFNMCLDVPYQNFNTGTLPWAYQCNNSNAQYWTVTDKTFTGEDGVQFRAYTLSPTANTNLCLDVHNANYNAGQVQLWWCNGSPAQAWMVGNQLVAAGAWHSHNSSSFQGAGTSCLAPSSSSPTNNSISIQLQQCTEGFDGFFAGGSLDAGSPSNSQLEAIVPVDLPLALYSNGFVPGGEDGQSACLNFQSWGSDAAPTLNTQWCQPQQTSLTVENSGAAASEPLPSIDQTFYFRFPVGFSSGVTLLSADLVQWGLSWTDDVNNPIATFQYWLPPEGDVSLQAQEQVWWMSGYDSMHGTLVSMTQPTGVPECVGGPEQDFNAGLPDNIAVNVVPCWLEPTPSIQPSSATSFDVGGMWK